MASFVKDLLGQIWNFKQLDDRKFFYWNFYSFLHLFNIHHFPLSTQHSKTLQIQKRIRQTKAHLSGYIQRNERGMVCTDLWQVRKDVGGWLQAGRSRGYVWGLWSPTTFRPNNLGKVPKLVPPVSSFDKMRIIINTFFKGLLGRVKKKINRAWLDTW